MFIFHNVPTSPVTIFSLYANVYKHVYGDFTKDENEKASTKTPFVVKQRQDEVTDLEKCCMTTTSGAFPSAEKKKKLLLRRLTRIYHQTSRSFTYSYHSSTMHSAHWITQLL